MAVKAMPVNAFIGRSEQPDEAELSTELGQAKATWDKLVNLLANEHEVTTREWKSYSPKAGWSLALKYKKRTIVYLIPCRGCFQVAFVLGDKAMRVARESKLPQRISKALDEAPRYVEGTGVRIEITGAKDIPTIEKLAAIKLAN
ncbi:MAG TPA: DUF3788 domain-containing protein [Terriglobales bacterium]|nr:DUF3788 domain-containing protein [Terriglobales bacterium]